MKTHHRETSVTNTVDNNGNKILVHFATETWWDEESKWMIIENEVWVDEGEEDHPLAEISKDELRGASVMRVSSRFDANRTSVEAFDRWSNHVQAWASHRSDARAP